MSHQEAKRKAQRMHSNREELIERMAAVLPEDGSFEAFPGLLGEDLDAASAGFRVGYENPSYFSREYKKLFGAPPQRDIAKLRSTLEL
jgi:AraC-like DNA-binding protein